jgi:hypothetical protein
MMMMLVMVGLLKMKGQLNFQTTEYFVVLDGNQTLGEMPTTRNWLRLHFH